MKNLFLLALFISLPLHAAKDKKINLKPTTPIKKEDVGSATHLLYTDGKKLQGTGSDEEKKKDGVVQMRGACTDPLGMTFQEGDAGYEGCLRTVDKAAPTSSQQKGKQSIGFTIK